MPTHTLSPVLAAIAALLLGSLPVPVQAAPWTTVGAVGVVDDADQGLYDFVLGEARMRAGAPAGSILNLRYNLVALAGFSGLNQAIWRVRFRDNGAGARVRLFLRQANSTGTQSSIATFDSNNYPAAVGYQTRTECIGVNWDFINGPFYIDAELSKLNGTGVPALSLMIVNNQSCIP